MIDVNAALQIVLQNCLPLVSELIPIDRAYGRILAENIYADIDMPPFPRSMMDGYAVRAADIITAPIELKNIGFIPAGSFPDIQIEPGTTAKIMTGAPLPRGADSVREIELTEIGSTDDSIRILKGTQPGQHVVQKGAELKAGSQVLSAGQFISPAVCGVFATAGKPAVAVYKRPTVTILSTGDELVAPDKKPGPGQIRDSNSFTLASYCQSLHLDTKKIGVATDDRDLLQHKIEQGLQADVLLISGGVSMGDLDFVESVFEALKLDIKFTKVAIKPGKPTVFATHKKGIVFGLPGNPVSAATIFEVFVRPALRKISGLSKFHNLQVSATITEKFTNKSNRSNYHPCITEFKEGQYFSRPLKTKGSADITGFSRLNSFLICPQDLQEIGQGERCNILLNPDFDLI